MTGPAPGDPKMVSYPKYTLAEYIPTRAKPSVSCEVSNRKAKGCSRREQRKMRVPKKETRSSARSELAMLCSKIKHCQLNSYPGHIVFSELDCG